MAPVFLPIVSAVAPKPQPHLYNAWFQEIYMETRETNPDGYQRAAPINVAEGLQGDLLIIHGTGETNTHLQITEGLVDRAALRGKQLASTAKTTWRLPRTAASTGSVAPDSHCR